MPNHKHPKNVYLEKIRSVLPIDHDDANITCLLIYTVITKE